MSNRAKNEHSLVIKGVIHIEMHNITLALQLKVDTMVGRWTIHNATKAMARIEKSMAYIVRNEKGGPLWRTRVKRTWTENWPIQPFSWQPGPGLRSWRRLTTKNPETVLFVALRKSI